MLVIFQDDCISCIQSNLAWCHFPFHSDFRSLRVSSCFCFHVIDAQLPSQIIWMSMAWQWILFRCTYKMWYEKKTQRKGRKEQVAWNLMRQLEYTTNFLHSAKCQSTQNLHTKKIIDAMGDKRIHLVRCWMQCVESSSLLIWRINGFLLAFSNLRFDFITFWQSNILKVSVSIQFWS